MTPSFVRVGAALLLAAALVTLGASRVSAHAVQTFGPYSIAIGWQHEPTYAGELNAVQLFVKDAHGTAVTDLDASTLHVQVKNGSVTSGRLDFEPAFDPDTGIGTPGEYDAALIPSVPGDYTFLLAATVHGTVINQSFTSGPTTFDTVHDPGSIEFPSSIPPSSQLFDRITRDSQRLQAAVAAAQSANDAAGRATILGIAGIVVALLAGGAMLIMRRQRSG